MTDPRAFVLTVVIEADADAIGGVPGVHEPHDAIRSDVLDALRKLVDRWPARWDAEVVSVAVRSAEPLPGPRCRSVDF